ncbi:Uncharacterised protein [Klebsiella variicola]|jgi:hypothetical protein|nr:Uncharacterised protein [Klebsiella variicola]
MAELTDRDPDFSFAEDTDDLFVGKRFFMEMSSVAYDDITKIMVY